MDVRSDLLPCFMFTGVIRTRQEVWFGSPGFPLGVSVSTTEPKASPPAGGESRPKGSKSVHEERTVELIAPPQGGRFKGYTDYVVQDLVIRAHIVNFRCEPISGRNCAAILRLRLPLQPPIHDGNSAENGDHRNDSDDDA
jgi:hypothetical protein